MKQSFTRLLTLCEPRDQGFSLDAPSSEEVALRAYFNYQNHGRIDGHDLTDWLRAEAELMTERRITEALSDPLETEILPPSPP